MSDLTLPVNLPLLERLRPLLVELSKFVVVGGFCFALDLAIANALHFGLDLGPTTAKTGSTIVATAASYAGNRMWSFADRVEQKPGQGRDAIVFVVINLVGLLITLVPVDVAHYLLNLSSALAFNVSSVLGTAVATVFRFWAYRRYVFTKDTAEHLALL